MKNKWKDFWQKYRIVNVAHDGDLLYQCGLTVGGKPIGNELFASIISDISAGLELDRNDCVLDLCCGNGMITFELAKKVQSIIGIDFSREYISNANKYKKDENIEYILHDITKLNEIKDVLELKSINKVLLYGSLAYFTSKDFEVILDNLSRYSKHITTIFIGGILDRKKIWKFYDTPARKFDLLIKTVLRNDPGVGKWWAKSCIKKLSAKKGYSCCYLGQNPLLHTAHYRFDVVLTKEK